MLKVYYEDDDFNNNLKGMKLSELEDLMVLGEMSERLGNKINIPSTLYLKL